MIGAFREGLYYQRSLNKSEENPASAKSGCDCIVTFANVPLLRELQFISKICLIFLHVKQGKLVFAACMIISLRGMISQVLQFFDLPLIGIGSVIV